MTHRRSPFKLRADGKPKGLAITRTAWTQYFPAALAMCLLGQLERPPSPRSAERTRSKQWRAGSRRTKRLARGAR